MASRNRATAVSSSHRSTSRSAPCSTAKVSRLSAAWIWSLAVSSSTRRSSPVRRLPPLRRSTSTGAGSLRRSAPLRRSDFSRRFLRSVAMGTESATCATGARAGVKIVQPVACPHLQSVMIAREHHRVDRRLLPPRRGDSERRLGERRLEVISLDEERRDQAERRRAADRRQPTGRRQGEARGDKLVVLVVSSQEDAARQVRELLEGADPDRFGVVAAEPQASLARLARGGVDVVLLAMSLSARRGLATFTELRALAPAIPFLFLSDSVDERHGLEAVRAGAQDFLVQTDLDGEHLARALRHAIERNRLHTALLDLALVDDLTGLYNRRGFLTLATRDLRPAHRSNETLLVAFADLDDLKGVNDAAGHAVGDRALRDTAALLRHTFRDSDLVARIGGDEYAVLVRHAGPESAGVLAERLKRQLRDFNRRAGRPYQLSISLGFAAHKANTLGSVAEADRELI